MSDDGPQDCTITIYHGETAAASFPPLLDGTRALDLTNKTLELYIRPSFDHATLIRKLTSSGGSAEIIIDSAVNGLAHVLISKANVIAGIPVGTWAQYLRIVDLGGTYTTYWRGPCIVKPGRDTV